MVQRSGNGDAGRMRKLYKQRDRAELLAAVRRGEPILSAARRLRVRMSTAYRWVRLSGNDDGVAAPPTFLELVTAGTPSRELMVRIGVAEIEVRPGFDPALLRAVVATLGGDA
jgi:transposase-like protein